MKMQLGSQYSQSAVKAARNGNMEKANEFAQRHREKVNEGKELTVKDPPVVKDVLDLWIILSSSSLQVPLNFPSWACLSVA